MWQEQIAGKFLELEGLKVEALGVPKALTRCDASKSVGTRPGAHLHSPIAGLCDIDTLTSTT
eukprot:330063-Amphidinium_carterae.2